MQKELYNTTYSKFMAICIRYATTTEDAEQWLHDGYVKIFNQTEKYNGVGNLEGWLRKIITNTCLDNLRQLKTQYNSMHFHTKQVSDAAYSYTAANDALLKMDATNVLQLVNSLPLTQKMVFNLYALDGYSHKEVAEQLNITEANSQWHLNQARQTLKKKLITVENYERKRI
jgi:RNA polymerase sigma-70 factor (ECF subfamily)